MTATWRSPFFAEADDERVVAERAVVGGRVLHAVPLRDEVDPGDPPAEHLEQGPHDGAGMGGAEAEVNAEAEGDVRISGGDRAGSCRPPRRPSRRGWPTPSRGRPGRPP